MIWTRLTAAVVVTVTMVASSTVAQAKRGSVAKLDVTNFDARSFDARRLIVKFAEGTGIRLRAGTLRAKADVDLDAVLELAKTATLERLFVEPDHVLDAQRAALFPATYSPAAQINSASRAWFLARPFYACVFAPQWRGVFALLSTRSAQRSSPRHTRTAAQSQKQ